MNKIIGIILIIGSLFIGYTGVNKVSNSGESVEVIGIELSASDEGEKTTGFILIGLALVAFAGGVTLTARKS